MPAVIMEYRITKLVVFLALSVLASTVTANETLPASQSLSASKHAIISRDVTVQNGDTLASIARRELGKSAFVSLLAQYNNIRPLAPLTPGDIVRIPIQVPPRGEFAEVVFVKGRVTAARMLGIGTLASRTTASVAGSVSDDAMSITSPDQNLEVIELTRGARIFSGDLISTSDDGFVSIAFSSGSVINLQPDTIASLDRLACLPADDSCLVQITTERGRVMSDVDARDQQPVEFRITTPYASAAVRGTVFDIDANSQLLVGVTEGAVDVSAQDETVGLQTGFGLVVEEGQPPGEPVELLPAPVFRRVPARIAQGDTLQWWPFTDAAAYKAVLSSDEAANAAISDIELPAGAAALDVKEALTEAVDSGDYFITLRAEDSNGLLGFPSNTRITLADIDPDIDPVTTTVVRQGSEFLVTIANLSDQARGYEIQIDRDSDFGDPLSVDVNEQGSAVFRIDQDQVFTRARVLVDPFTVSAFGEPSSN